MEKIFLNKKEIITKARFFNNMLNSKNIAANLESILPCSKNAGVKQDNEILAKKIVSYFEPFHQTLHSHLLNYGGMQLPNTEKEPVHLPNTPEKEPVHLLTKEIMKLSDDHVDATVILAIQNSNNSLHEAKLEDPLEHTFEDLQA